MKPSSLIPAAEYVRMSTDRQDYSIPQQQYAIAQYAHLHRFKVVRTYADEGKSGLVLRDRTGLQNLLRDVASDDPGFNTILVYDVSRWGRFQDVDEAAHYEFLCRSAGIPVHYCAECFENDGKPANAILKVLKRSMAAEYSSALSDRVSLAQKRLVQLGFAMGQRVVYGFRRVLVTSDGNFRQVLNMGDRKNLRSDRVVYEKGPKNEVKVVRRIFRLALKHGAGTIASRLNRDQIPSKQGGKWTKEVIGKLIRNPIYAGFYVWGKTTCRLKSSRVPVPSKDWIVKRLPGPPIVSESLFQRVQRAITKRRERMTDEQLLDEFRKLLACEGKLSAKSIEKKVKHRHVAAHRFGGFLGVYRKLGYHPPARDEKAALNNVLSRSLRSKMIQTLIDAFPTRLTGFQISHGMRLILRLDGAIPVSVVLARSHFTERGAHRWRITVVPSERSYVTLVGLPSEDNTRIESYYLFPGLGMTFSIDVCRNDNWFRFGVPLKSTKDFCDTVIAIQNAKIVTASHDKANFQGARIGACSKNLIDMVTMAQERPLVGWKEIGEHLKLTQGQAQYLGKMGLPRFREGGRACAWPKEIDCWTQSRLVRRTRPPTQPIRHPLRERRLHI